MSEAVKRFCPWCMRETTQVRTLVVSASELVYPIDECQECHNRSPLLAEESEDA
jgi:hypothetical protein